MTVWGNPDLLQFYTLTSNTAGNCLYQVNYECDDQQFLVMSNNNVFTFLHTLCFLKASPAPHAHPPTQFLSP